MIRNLLLRCQIDSPKIVFFWTSPHYCCAERKGRSGEREFTENHILIDRSIDRGKINFVFFLPLYFHQRDLQQKLCLHGFMATFTFVRFELEEVTAVQTNRGGKNFLRGSTRNAKCICSPTNHFTPGRKWNWETFIMACHVTDDPYGSAARGQLWIWIYLTLPSTIYYSFHEKWGFPFP